MIPLSKQMQTPSVLRTPQAALLAFCIAATTLHAQTPAPSPATPEWAQPGSATHAQVAPPPDFHRPSTNFNIPLGIFTGQSDVGSAVVPGSASFDATAGKYTIHSA